MQQPIEQTSSAELKSTKLRFLPYIITAVAVGLTLFAIFAMDAWAETSGWHHAAQHVMIFGSGAAAGVSLLGNRKNRKDA